MEADLSLKLWLLYTKLPTPQSKQAAAGVQLRKEVVKLNREMTNTSAQDDFSKWAKLRRQHDKKKAEYEKNGATHFYPYVCSQQAY